MIKSKNGFFIVEIIVALAIIITFSSFLLVNLKFDWCHYDVELLTREIIMDLQWVRQGSQNNSLHGADDWCLALREHEYVILHNKYSVCKRRVYNHNAYVDMYGQKEFRFDELGRPKGNNMKITVQSTNGNKQTIVIAASTGRIRIE